MLLLYVSSVFVHTKYNWNVVIYRYFPIVWLGVNQESGENRVKMLKHKDSLKGIFHPLLYLLKFPAVQVT